MPEFFLLATYVALLVAMTHPREARVVRWLVGLACVTAIVSHLFGFKLYGRPVLARIEHLNAPRRVIALEPPHVLRFADGTSAELAHVFFPKPIDLMHGKTNYYGVFVDAVGLARALSLRQDQQQWPEVELSPAGTDSTGAVSLRRVNYGCGNTWFPGFLPRRLPESVREDFGVALVRAGLALPDADYVRKAPAFRDPLLGALNGSWMFDLPPQHPEIIRLGLALLDRGQFEAALRLLVETDATNVFPQVGERIRDLETGRLTVDAFALPIDSRGWLLKLDPKAASIELQRRLSQEKPDQESCGMLSATLVRFGDFSGFVEMFRVLRASPQDREYRAKLARILAGWARFDFELNGGGFPDDIAPELSQWFDTNRERLCWKHLADGRQGFSFTNGAPGDEAYFASMLPYKQAAAVRLGRPIFRSRISGD